MTILKRLKAIKTAPLLLAAALLLTGCLARPEGGANTKAGMAAIERSDPQSALASFEQALSAGEDRVMAYRGQGIAYMALAMYDEAAASFDEALANTDRKMPETVRDIRFYKASALLRAERYEEVLEECTLMLESEESAQACFFCGAASLKLGQAEAAREYFDRAVACSRSDYTLYLQIYEAYEEEDQTAVGDEYLQTALGINPENSEDSYRLGQIYYYLEKYDDACRVLAAPVEKEYVPAITLLGETYLAMGDTTHAMASYQSVMDIKGESPSAYNGLALCAMESGDYDGALRLIEQGLSMEEEEGKQQLRFNEIVAYERKLGFATALVKAEAYMELYPSDEEGARELRFLNTRGQ